MNYYIDKYLPIIATAIVTYILTAFIKRRERGVVKEDKKEDTINEESKAERSRLARTLELLKEETARVLETDRKDRADILHTEQKDLTERIRLIENILIELKTQIKPIWAAVQSSIVKDLTHPNPRFEEPDGLLEEFDSDDISIKGLDRLLILMEERMISTDSEVSSSEKKSAKILHGEIKNRIERKEDKDAT